MLNRPSIANRGEIVPRIIRIARWLGVRTPAVYSNAHAPIWRRV
jgi:acetyl/propionyl-CoA carboxylase alpha subunit